MKSLTVFFDEPAPVVTEAVHLVFALVGGLDLAQPTKYHRYGLNICEDFIGYPVKAPKEVSFEEIHAVTVQLANLFGVAAVMPAESSELGMREAINHTMRAVAVKNGKDLTGFSYLSLEIQDFDTDDLLFHLCENIGDGNNVTNYWMHGA